MPTLIMDHVVEAKSGGNFCVAIKDDGKAWVNDHYTTCDMCYANSETGEITYNYL